MATADKIAKALGQQSSAPPHLKAALAYAASGLAVLPLNPRTKEPATKRGFYDATTTGRRSCPQGTTAGAKTIASA